MLMVLLPIPTTSTRLPLRSSGLPAAQAIMGNDLMRADTQVAEPTTEGRGLQGGTSCGYSIHHDSPVFDALTVAVYGRDDVSDAEAGALAGSMLGDTTPEPLGEG